jgi:hypothetical protein
MGAIRSSSGNPPNPEEMLSLLTSADVSERMIGSRAFCELRDERAIAPY